MIHLRSKRSTLVAAGLLSFLASCGGSQGTRTTTNEHVLTQATATPAPAIDQSEVAAPEDLLAVVRVASVNQLIERVGAVTGMGEIVSAQVDEAFANWHNPLASIADRNGSVELVITTRGRNNSDAAFAFGGPSMDEVERALANTHRLVPLANGVRRIEATTDDHPHDTEHCLVSPALRASTTRIVCSDHANVAERVLPYIVRTLGRHEATPNAITLDVPMEAARRNFLAEAIANIDHHRAELDQNLGQNAHLDPAMRDAILPLAHDAFDALRGLLNDPTLFGASLTFDADRITLHTALDMRDPQSRLLQAGLAMMRPAGPLPPDMLSHLLPGGYAYFGGTADQSAFQPTMRQLVTLGELLIQHAEHLDAQDRAALRAALDAIPTLGPIAEAFAMGADEAGHIWMTGTLRAQSVQPAQTIASSRTVMAVLRRPHIQAEIRTLLGATHTHLPDLGDLRELPTTGLPAGSLLIQLPPYSALRTAMQQAASSASSSSPPPSGTRGRPEARPARPATARAPRGRRAPAEPALQLLLVPDGQDVVMIMGTDARAIRQRYIANTTPGVDPQYLNAPNSAFVMAMVLNGLPNVLRASSERESRQLGEALQSVSDHGATPILFRMGVTSANQQTTLAFDTVIAAVTVRNMVQMVTRTMSQSGGAHTGAPPAGPLTP